MLSEIHIMSKANSPKTEAVHSLGNGGGPDITSLAAVTVSSDVKQENNTGGSVADSGIDPQKLIIDTSVAPFVSRSMQPFDLGDRKKAYKSAVYYSECYILGVKPTDADNAANDVTGTYNKWWVDSNFYPVSNHNNSERTSGKDGINQGRSTHLLRTDENGSVGGLKRGRDEETVRETARITRKRRHRRGGVRDVIDAVTVEPHDSEANSHCGVVTLSGSDVNVDEITSCDEDFSSRKRLRLVSSDSSTDDSAFTVCKSPSLSSTLSVQQASRLRSELLEELNATGGDTQGASFLSKLGRLNAFYQSSRCDARKKACRFDLDGSWLTLSKPTYFECKGRNSKGNYLYTLGRMAFDMFRPTNMLCSIQGIFNTVHEVSRSSYASISVPRSLRKKIRSNTSLDGTIGLRTYNIVVAFTTESDEENSRPIRGIMTNYGYVLPDPDVPNRLSIWFTGGSLEVNDEGKDLNEWKRLFHHDRVPKRDMREFARVLASKILLGAHVPETMDDDGTMQYWLKRPIGGHGRAFCDVIYLDESLRIMRGHQGSIFVFSKVAS